MRNENWGACLADVVEAVLLPALHGVAAAQAAHPVQEVLQHLASVLREVHLRVELYAVELLLFVFLTLQTLFLAWLMYSHFEYSVHQFEELELKCSLFICIPLLNYVHKLIEDFVLFSWPSNSAINFLIFHLFGHDRIVH